MGFVWLSRPLSLLNTEIMVAGFWGGVWAGADAPPEVRWPEDRPLSRSDRIVS